MSLGFSFHIGIACNYCKRMRGHKPDCPLHRIQVLQKQQKYIPCPKCGAHSVDINVDDLYECRECHTQYTTCHADDSWERVQLIGDMDVLISEGLIHALVYLTKGTGKFRIDQAIEEVQKEIEAIEAKKNRRRRN